MANLYLGVEIGGTKLQLVLGLAGGEIVERIRLQVDSRRGGAGIREQIEVALPGLIRGRPMAGGGVGFGGPVDWRTGVIACSHQVEGWSGFALGSWLESQIHAPVRVENDANTAALGEALAGAGRGINPVFYVTMGSGVGGGLVVDRQIYHGRAPGEAEFGHLRLDRDGMIIESRCSGWAVDRRIRTAIVEEPSGVLARLAAGLNRGEAQFLRPALDQGDRLAQRLLVEVAEDLAMGLSHVVHLCHPSVVVLGGGLSLVGDPLRLAVAKALPRFVMSAFAPGPEIVLAGLAEDVVPVGALFLAEQIGA